MFGFDHNFHASFENTKAKKVLATDRPRRQGHFEFDSFGVLGPVKLRENYRLWHNERCDRGKAKENVRVVSQLHDENYRHIPNEGCHNLQKHRNSRSGKLNQLHNRLFNTVHFVLSHQFETFKSSRMF